jgi:hypothetical protein
MLRGDSGSGCQSTRNACTNIFTDRIQHLAKGGNSDFALDVCHGIANQYQSRRPLRGTTGTKTANLEHSGAIRRAHPAATNGWISFAVGTGLFTAPVTGTEALRLQRHRRFGRFAKLMIYLCLPGPRLMLSFMVGST